jgi:hypothetical protein
LAPVAIASPAEHGGLAYGHWVPSCWCSGCCYGALDAVAARVTIPTRQEHRPSWWWAHPAALRTRCRSA